MKLLDIKFARFNRTIALLCLAFACNPGYAERADRDKPVHLESDHGSVDDVTQVSTFEGKVALIQGTMAIRADKLVVVQDSNGFSHGTATGQPASYRQKREGIDEYVEGYGDRIEYDAPKETVDFFGHAHVIRKQDDVRGDHITYNSHTEIFQVYGTKNPATDASGTGRVHATLQPKAKVNVPATEALPIKPAETLSLPEGAHE
jgi:lipopolysaccharide export system protein LptA